MSIPFQAEMPNENLCNSFFERFLEYVRVRGLDKSNITDFLVGEEMKDKVLGSNELAFRPNEPLENQLAVLDFLKRRLKEYQIQGFRRSGFLMKITRMGIINNTLQLDSCINKLIVLLTECEKKLRVKIAAEEKPYQRPEEEEVRLAVEAITSEILGKLRDYGEVFYRYKKRSDGLPDTVNRLTDWGEDRRGLLDAIHTGVVERLKQEIKSAVGNRRMKMGFVIGNIRAVRKSRGLPPLGD